MNRVSRVGVPDRSARCDVRTRPAVVISAITFDCNRLGYCRVGSGRARHAALGEIGISTLSCGCRRGSECDQKEPSLHLLGGVGVLFIVCSLGLSGFLELSARWIP